MLKTVKGKYKMPNMLFLVIGSCLLGFSIFLIVIGWESVARISFAWWKVYVTVAGIQACFYLWKIIR